MANLNLSFLLLQTEQCQFKPSITSSKLKHGSKINIAKRQQEQDINLQEIQFEDIQENIFVLADEESGTIALCGHEIFKSTNHKSIEEEKSKDKFLVRFQPKIMLVPSVSEIKCGQLISHCFVRCPAPNILNASPIWLCTLHQDNIVRLWNIDDGRCVANSSFEMLSSKGLFLKNIKGFPGSVILIGDQGDIYVVNVYTMQVTNHLCSTFKGFVKCKYDPFIATLEICDANGCITEYIDAQHDNNEKFRVDDYTHQGFPKELTQKQMLHLTKHASPLNFKFEQHLAIDGMSSFNVRRLKECKVLTYSLVHPQSMILVIAQDQIEQISFSPIQNPDTTFNINVKLPICEFTQDKILIFAKFVGKEYEVPKFLITINIDCILSVWDVSKLLAKYQPSEEELMVLRVRLVEPEFDLDLFKACQVFDFHKVWIKDGFFNKLLSDFNSQEDALDASMNLLKGILIRSFGILKQKIVGGKSPKLFKFLNEEQVLYSTVQTTGDQFTKAVNLMLSWDFEGLFINGTVNKQYKPLVCITNLQLFGSQLGNEGGSPNCPLSFNDLIMHSYFNKQQFDFFFTDEKITTTVTFFDKDIPSLILGTNYGRICIVPMFQEVEDNVLPITLIDSHRRQPIEHLYVAYQYARSIDREKGGHLISTSSDGTVCITELSSNSLLKYLQEYQQKHKVLLGRDKRRIDQFLSTRAKNQKSGRRNSMTNCFTTQNFYHYVRVQADQVFLQQTSSPIKQIFKVKTLQETIQFLQGPDKSPAQQPSQKIQDPSKSPDSYYYACVTEDSNEMVLLTLSRKGANFKSEKLPHLSEPVNGVYLDSLSQNLMIILKNSLQMQQYNIRTQQLSLKKRQFADVLKLFQVDEAVDVFFQSYSNFLNDLPAKDLNILEFQNFEKEDSSLKHNILKGNGSHRVLDYLNLGLTLPVQYAPQAALTLENSKICNDFMQHKADLIGYRRTVSTQAKNILQEQKNKIETQENVVRTINKVLQQDQDQLYGSDLNYRLYKQVSGITAIQTKGENILGSNQQVLIANTQDIINVLQRQMLKQRQQKQGSIVEESKRDDLSQNKWPAKILSFLHPFNLDDGLDESLEQFFNLNLPFLDFRIGMQGVKHAFSFVIAKEDQNYHQERDHLTKIISLLKISKSLKQKIERNKLQNNNPLKVEENLNFQNFIIKYIDPLDASLFLGRFFNSENWKVSMHMSTLIPQFFLSILVSLIDFNEVQLQEITQEWLGVLQLINSSAQFRQTSANPLAQTKDMSLSLMSELMLKNDLNISSCAKDIICKPFLCNQSDKSHKILAQTINDWLALVIDTYEQLKQDTKPLDQLQRTDAPDKKFERNALQLQRYMTVRGEYNDHSRSTVNQINDRFSINQNDRGTMQNSQGSRESEASSQTYIGINGAASSSNTSYSRRPLFQYFGQIEIRGLISLTFYAFYCQNEQFKLLDKQVLERVSKLVIVLIKEVVQRFQDNKRFINLLSTLLYLLQCNLKTATDNFKKRAIIEDVVTLLLFIFNFYKPALNREQFITRILAQNFHLIRPTNAELYLKLSAAKALLEIGVSFTDVFLELIQQHAITLVKGTEHQKNVLESLRYFINGYGDNLERYLVQIVHILLQCLDPNELALRKNSHKYVSVILSTMVKIFPMVAFHHETQRLAVGTHEGPIGIYDVRTSAKWKVLEGHTSNVTCLSFDSKGNYLASYSAIDRTLKLWKVGNTGFFSTIIGGTGKQSNHIILRNLGSNVANPHIHVPQESKQQALDSRVTSLLPQTEGLQLQQSQNQISKNEFSQRINRCRIVFIKPQEKEVELVREDGSKELHDLVK